MEPPHIRLGPRRERAIDAASLTVRRAGLLQMATLTLPRKRLINGDAASRLEAVQSQTLAPRAMIAIFIREIFKSFLGVPVRTGHLYAGQKLDHSCADQDRRHVNQHEPQFQIDGNVEHHWEVGHCAPRGRTESQDGFAVQYQGAATPGVSSMNRGPCTAAPVAST